MEDVSFNQPINADTLPGGIAKQGDQILDLMSAGWTNERHSLYISSMEASFMEQLYGNEQHRPVPNRSHVVANGFKVLREGEPENLRFERKGARARDEGVSFLPENPWIRRFRPRNSGVNHHGDGVRASVDDGESGTDTVQGRVSAHERKVQSFVRENLVGKSTGHYRNYLVEVSDQNFPDEDKTNNERSKSCKKRRPTPSSAVSNDQAT